MKDTERLKFVHWSYQEFKSPKLYPSPPPDKPRWTRNS